MRFRAKITSSCIGVAYLRIKLDHIAMPVVRTDRRSVGVRSRDYQIFSNG